MKQLILFFGVLFFASSIHAVPPTEVRALMVFKEGVFDDPKMVLSNWNALDSNPCNWGGVSCLNDHVNKINISGCSLKGFIAEEVSQLTYLRELMLHDNNFIGPIPKEIGLLKHLKILDLGKNQLSGPIPHEIGGLISVLKM
ncbi:probable LRR receptor-like serine/threonine-protein kinase [Tanacetum coccineum]